jgi:hypothetical protein
MSSQVQSTGSQVKSSRPKSSHHYVDSGTRFKVFSISGQVMSSQVKSSQVKSNQPEVKSSQVIQSQDTTMLTPLHSFKYSAFQVRER